MVGRTGSPPSLGYSSAGVLNKRWLYLTVASPALILETFPYASIKVDVCLVLVVFYLFSVLSLHANRKGSVQGSVQSFLSIDSTDRHTPPKPLTACGCMLFCKHLCASASLPDTTRNCQNWLRASRNGAGNIAATSSSPTELRDPPLRSGH